MSIATYNGETNNIADFGYTAADVDYAVTVPLSDKNLVKIDRLRLLSDPGFPMWDVSYCWGVMKDGRKVVVDLGVDQISKRNAFGDLIKAATKAGRFAKGLGLLDRAGVWSTIQ